MKGFVLYREPNLCGVCSVPRSIHQRMTGAQQRCPAAHVWVFVHKRRVRELICRVVELGSSLKTSRNIGFYHIYIRVCVCSGVLPFLKCPSEIWALFCSDTVISLQLFTRRGLLWTVYWVFHPLYASPKSKNVTKWILNYIWVKTPLKSTKYLTLELYYNCFRLKRWKIVFVAFSQRLYNWEKKEKGRKKQVQVEKAK